MANMSYCRFRNTLSDLYDCSANFDEAESEEEVKAREKLLKLCSKMVADSWEDIFDQSLEIKELD